MEKDLAGKIAVVTGGSRGIGRAIAERLLRDGAQVAICSRSAAAVRQAVRELAEATGGIVDGHVADVSDLEQVRAFFRFVDQRFGGLDILVNNAGIGIFAPVADLTAEQWRRTIETNLTGVYYCCHEALPRFRNRGGGFIINISSLAAKNAFAGGAAYNASKFGLNGFTEALMLDHRYENVRVCSVMPGSVATEFSARAPDSSWKIAPEDVADVVSFVLRMPARTLVSRVEIRPSRPAR
ncbi:MAG: SDR family oxidoreductase [Bryobacterales bacterium]|nr:SDR family oxidoreductase [Bryobacterales bacterium]